ncbi:bifunctional riboflavin kinase/FAD synthetase [Moraxella sp. ZJ142]|uniref:bifunctional riboflavin kinase/FAD synthetase n=1 Tax=Moraxella marmotae TaxID=3344520 RepID=UPI0035D3EB18
MKVIQLDIHNPPTLPPVALTIGNYDGVHLGHQALLSALSDDARQMQLAQAVMVFEPQPREFFLPDNPPARLTSIGEKISQIAKLGVDYLLVASFDDAFRSLSAQDFSALLKNLNVAHLVLGDDFRFGHDRVGDKAFLAKMGFSVDNLPSITQNGVRISSSKVREALANGKLEQAASLLGRAYSITGQVVHGDKIGRTFGFPTANVALNRLKPALHGVYAADVLAYRDGVLLDWQDLGEGQGVAGLMDGSRFAAVSVGLRPSVKGKDWRLEVHLPHFAGDLYGLELQVILTHFLHGERHYTSIEALTAGISQDVQDLLAWRHKQPK